MPARRELIFGFTAKADLKKIWNFRATDHSPQSADKVLRAIYSAAEHLVQFPEMSSSHLSERFGVHILIAGYYLIVYDITGDHIQILRVVDGRRGDLSR